MRNELSLGRRGAAFLLAVLCFCLAGIWAAAPAAAGGGAAVVRFDTPILAVWRDPNAFLVVQTDYGNFSYIYDALVPARDGGGMLALSDPGAALLRAIFANADGRPVSLYVSTQGDNLLVGLNDVLGDMHAVPPARTLSPERSQ